MVTSALELCLRTFASATDSGVKMASRGSASQLVTSYCTSLYKERAEAETDFSPVFGEVSFRTDVAECKSERVILKHNFQRHEIEFKYGGGVSDRKMKFHYRVLGMVPWTPCLP